VTETRLNFSIRPILDADLDAVLELYRQSEDFLALGPAAHASPEMVAGDRALSQQQGGVFCGIYKCDLLSQAGPGTINRTLIFLMGILDYAPDYGGEPGVTFIELLMIAPAYRRQGLGAAMVSWLLAETHAHTLRAAVQVNNPLAIRFWQRLGFRITGPAEPQTDGTTTYPIQWTAA